MSSLSKYPLKMLIKYLSRKKNYIQDEDRGVPACFSTVQSISATDLIYYCKLSGKAKGFPELLYFGKCAKIDCLVMELLGPNLEAWLPLLPITKTGK